MAVALALAVPPLVASPALAAPTPDRATDTAFRDATASSSTEGHTADETRALAKAADSGEPVEVLSQRTETSQVFANPEGDFTQDTYATAQWVRKDNRLVDIDATLVKNDDGTYSAKATEVGVHFSGGGTGPLVTVRRDGRSLSFDWPDKLPRPHVEDDTVTYPGILDGVDLKLKAHNGGFNQVLVVKSAKAAANPRLAKLEFALDASGVRAEADEHGNIRALNPAGQEVFTAPTPRMWDSSRPDDPALARALASNPPDGGGFEPGPGAKDASMGVELGSGTLSLTPDEELLTGKNTQYPVYLDPSVEGSRHSWALVYKKYPNTSYFNGAGFDGGTSTARVGYENHTNGLARSYFRMNTKNLQNKNRVISKSTFRIKNNWSWSCSARKVELWRTEYLKKSHTWNNKPVKRSHLATVNDAKGYNSSCPGGNLAFDTTKSAKESQANGWNTITFGLEATDESDVFSWKKFAAKSAVLSTTYNTRPSVPTSLDTIPSTKNSKGCGDVSPYGLIGNTDIYLTARAKDADGGTIRITFHLWPTGHHKDGKGLVVDKTVSVSSGTVAKLKVTKATLAPHIATANGNFSWKARAHDGTLYSDWTPTLGAPGCRFVFDPNRPSSPPGVTSAQYPDGTDGWPVVTGSVRTEGTFTLSSSGVKDVAAYEYWTSSSPTVRTATATTAGGSVSVKFTPTASGPNVFYARSIDRAGNKSDTAGYLFYAKGPTEPDKPGDINGDGHPDLWAIDKDGTLERHYGAGDGSVTQATSAASNSTWNDAWITHRGDWTGNGYEDLVALRRDTTLNTNRLWIHPNNGHGFACTDCAGDENDRRELTVYDSTNNHWRDADQILAIGDVDGPLDVDDDGTPDIPGHPDLLVKEGDLLWLYFGAADGRLDTDRDPVLIGPDNWKDKDLIAPGDAWGDARVDLISRHTRTGELHLYTGRGDDGDGLADESTKLRTGTGFTKSYAPLLTSPGDADRDGFPDLWTVLDIGELWFVPRVTKGDQPLVNLGGDWAGHQQFS